MVLRAHPVRLRWCDDVLPSSSEVFRRHLALLRPHQKIGETSPSNGEVWVGFVTGSHQPNGELWGTLPLSHQHIKRGGGPVFVHLDRSAAVRERAIISSLLGILKAALHCG